MMNNINNKIYNLNKDKECYIQLSSTENYNTDNNNSYNNNECLSTDINNTNIDINENDEWNVIENEETIPDKSLLGNNVSSDIPILSNISTTIVNNINNKLYELVSKINIIIDKVDYLEKKMDNFEEVLKESNVNKIQDNILINSID